MIFLRRRSVMLAELAKSIDALAAATREHSRAVEYHAVQLQRVLEDRPDVGLEETSMELARSAIGLEMAQKKVSDIARRLS